MAQIGYIIMPPGTGKSHLHGKIPGLIEADTLVNCKATEELRMLRKIAKKANVWTEYDAVWVRELKAKLPEGRVVVLVPDNAVGVALGGERLATCVLSDQEWGRNLGERSKTVNDYRYAELSAMKHHPIYCVENADTEYVVLESARLFLGQ